MSDETFFREVNEEIRQQRVHDLWRRFGRGILALAVLVLVATGVYLGWRQYTISRANAAGDQFIAAVDLADADKFDEAMTQLQAIAGGGVGAYPRLADLRLAGIKARQGDTKGALDGFDAVAKDANVVKSLRDIAAIRAGYVLVDAGSFADVRDRVERLSGDSEPLRFAAREAMGLAAWKAGNLDEARRFLTQNRDDTAAPSGIALRARILMELVDAGTTPESAAAAAAAAPAAPAPVAPEILPSPIPLDLGVPSATPDEPSAEADPATPATDTPSEGATAPETQPAASAPVPATEAAPAPAAEAPAAEAPATQAPPAAEPAPIPVTPAPATSDAPAPPAPSAPSGDAAPAAPAAPAN